MAIPYTFAGQTGTIPLAELDSNFAYVGDSSGVTYVPSGTGAVTTTVQSKLQQTVSAFDFMTSAQITSVQARNGVQDVTTALQAFFDACKGGKGYLPPGTYTKSSVITLDPTYSYEIEGSGYASDDSNQGTIIKDTGNNNGLQVVYSYAQYAPGGGADARGGPNSDNLVKISKLSLRGPGNNTLPGTQSIQLYDAGPVTVTTGTGIWAYWANNFWLEDVWVSQYPAGGYYGTWCFGSGIKNSYFVKNRSFGIQLVDTNNLFQLNGVKAVNNGVVSLAAASFNCLITASGSTHPNLGVVVGQDSDFEGGGSSALSGYIFSQTAGTLTSLVVAAGVATATFTSAPSFLAGHYIGVTGGSTGSSNAVLNTITPAIVATVVGYTITYPTTASAATYSVTGLQIAPYVSGLGLNYVYGATVNAYAEGCTGAPIYVYGTSRAVTITGCSFTAGKLFIDTPVASNTAYAYGISVFGNQFYGVASGIYAATELGVVLYNNQYIADTTGTPTCTLGAYAVAETGNIIVQGGQTGRGTNVYTGANAPSDVTNWGSGVNTLQNIQNTGSGGSGLHNSAFGYYAAAANSTGYNNTAIGYNSLLANSTGYQNTAVGARTLDATAGTNIQTMVAVGFAAGSGISSGSGETNVGVSAGLRDTASASNGNNTHIGVNAGRITNSALVDSITVVGAQASGYAPTSGLTNLTTVGYNTQNDALAASNTTILGNSSATTAVIHGKVRLDSTYLSSSTTNTVTNKIKVNIGGTDYYLLASTSGT
jgi:hypothetical protein